MACMSEPKAEVEIEQQLIQRLKDRGRVVTGLINIEKQRLK